MSQNLVNQLLQSAMIAAQSSQFEVVKQNCLQILSFQPDNPHALHMLGKVAEVNLDLAQAISYYKQVLKTLEDEHIYISIAMLYQNGEEYELAMEAYKKALQFNPGLEIAFKGIRACAENEDLHDVGLKLIATIASTNPSATHASINYFQLLEHKIDKLIEADDFESAMDSLILLIEEANFLPVSFLSSKLIIQKGGVPPEIVKSYKGINEIFILCIGAMGYLFNDFHSDAEQITAVLFEKLHVYISENPEDNRAWRILSLATGIYKDRDKGNKVLRDFLSNLPSNALNLNAVVIA